MLKISNKKNYFYNHSENINITLSGENIIDFLNYFSIKKIISHKPSIFYTILMYKKIYLAETLIIFRSEKKCIITFDNQNLLNKTLKFFNIIKRKFPFLDISITAKNISLISIHSLKIDKNNCSFHSQFKPIEIYRQGYKHLIIYSSYKNINTIISYLYKNNFSEIDIENYYLFLYNNKVIPTFNGIKRSIKYKLLQNLYNADNYKFKFSKKIISVKLFKTPKNIITSNNSLIYNSLYKKAGYLYRSFHNANNKRPLLLCLVYKYKIIKYGVIRDIKTQKKILIKEQITYK